MSVESNRSLHSELSVESVLAGIEVLDMIRQVPEHERSAWVASLVTGIAYEFLGEDYTQEDAGNVMTAFYSGYTHLEHRERSLRWRQEEAERRANQAFEE